MHTMWHCGGALISVLVASCSYGSSALLCYQLGFVMDGVCMWCCGCAMALLCVFLAVTHWLCQVAHAPCIMHSALEELRVATGESSVHAALGAKYYIVWRHKSASPPGLPGMRPCLHAWATKVGCACPWRRPQQQYTCTLLLQVGGDAVALSAMTCSLVKSHRSAAVWWRPGPGRARVCILHDPF